MSSAFILNRLQIWVDHVFLIVSIILTQNVDSPCFTEANGMVLSRRRRSRPAHPSSKTRQENEVAVETTTTRNRQQVCRQKVVTSTSIRRTKSHPFRRYSNRKIRVQCVALRRRMSTNLCCRQTNRNPSKFRQQILKKNPATILIRWKFILELKL